MSMNAILAFCHRAVAVILYVGYEPAGVLLSLCHVTIPGTVPVFLGAKVVLFGLSLVCLQ